MAAIVPAGWNSTISDWDKHPDTTDASGEGAEGPGGTELIWANLSDWDKVVIAGTQVRALASVETERTQRIQRDATPQADGTVMKPMGQDPSSINIKLRFFNVADLSDFSRFLKANLVKAPGKPYTDPIAVSHPALAVAGIARMVLEGYSTPKSSGPGGTMDVMLRFLEFMPQKAMGRTGVLGKTTVDFSGAAQAALGSGPPAKPSTEGAAHVAPPGKH